MTWMRRTTISWPSLRGRNAELNKFIYYLFHKTFSAHDECLKLCVRKTIRTIVKIIQTMVEISVTKFVSLKLKIFCKKFQPTIISQSARKTSQLLNLS